MAEFQKAPDQFITAKMTQMQLAEAFCLPFPVLRMKRKTKKRQILRHLAVSGSTRTPRCALAVLLAFSCGMSKANNRQPSFKSALNRPDRSSGGSARIDDIWTLYCEVPRKNAKSTLGGPVGFISYFRMGMGAEVYSCAGDREQAAIIFNIAKQMWTGPATSRADRTRRSIVLYHDTGSAFLLVRRRFPHQAHKIPTRISVKLTFSRTGISTM